jgi:hypothetical protein
MISMDGLMMLCRIQVHLTNGFRLNRDLIIIMLQKAFSFFRHCKCTLAMPERPKP